MKALAEKVEVEKIVCEKDGQVFAFTKAVTVKDMHDAASEARRKGAKIFFAAAKEA